jgi:hypothetical protein
MYTINFWPILVASVVAFVISALWYSPILFGKEWMALTKMSDADMDAAKAKGVWKYYVIQFIVTLVTFAVLAFIIVSTGVRGGSNGAFMGFLVWLGFVLTADIGRLIWENKPFKLIVIQSVANLVNLVIGGAIMGMWK